MLGRQNALGGRILNTWLVMKLDVRDTLKKDSLPAAKERKGVTGFNRFAIAIACAVFIAICVAVLADRILVPYLEDQNILVSRSWKEDTWKMAQMSYQRWQRPDGCTVLQSVGIPTAEKKPKSKRILVAGDSFCAGYVLANINDAWWRALHRELIRRGYNDVDVIGLCGYYGSTASILEKLERWGKKYNPDLILLGYVCDDPEEFEGKRYIVPYLKTFEPDAPTRLVRRVLRTLLPNIAEVYISWQDKQENSKLSGPERGFDYNPRELELLKGKNIKQYQKTLQHMSDLMKRWNLPCYVISLPCVAGFYPELDVSIGHSEFVPYVHNYYKERYDRIAPYFEKARLEFVNLLEPYIAMLRTEPKLKSGSNSAFLSATPADGHPGGLVTHFYACQVVDLLERKCPSVLGGKSQPLEKFPININDWMPPNTNVYKVSDSSYVFLVPPFAASQLFMPVRQPHVQMNLEMPAGLKKIRLNGPGLKKSTIWLSSVDPKDGYDTRVLHPLGTLKGHDVTWQLPDEAWARSVNTIKVSAEVKGPDRRVAISF